MPEQTHDVVKQPQASPVRPPVDEDLERPLPNFALRRPSPLRWFFLLGAFLLPFAVEACFVVMTREVIVVNTLWDYLGWGWSLATGLVCIWQLPISRLGRTVLSAIFVPIMGCMLVEFLLDFIGLRYGLWL